MKEIRIGNTINITWNLTVHGAVIEELDLMLQRNEPLRKVKNIPFTLDGNALKFEHDGVAQKECGVYSYSLWANYGKPDQAVIDTCPAYKLIPRDCGELDTDNQIVMNALIIGISNQELKNRVEYLESLLKDITGPVELSDGQGVVLLSDGNFLKFIQ